jgi:crotonobetainyl-CoA:carnitine CoA-transferase CaiB-like acyl-CoA transferase
MCAWGITVALYSREKTGKGQVVDTSLMGSLVAMLGLPMEASAVLGQEFGRRVRVLAGNVLYNHYRCKDGKWIVIAHLQPDKYWPIVCKALGLQEIVDDPRFGSIPGRAEHAAELVAIFDARFATKTRDEWMKTLKEGGCICTPIQSAIEVTRDPQAMANNYFIDVEHPDWGKIKMVGFPWDFSETPAAWRCKAPGLGQHTDEVLKEAGFSDEEITRFREQGAIV